MRGQPLLPCAEIPTNPAGSSPGANRQWRALHRGDQAVLQRPSELRAAMPRYSRCRAISLARPPPGEKEIVRGQCRLSQDALEPGRSGRLRRKAAEDFFE